MTRKELLKTGETASYTPTGDEGTANEDDDVGYYNNLEGLISGLFTTSVVSSNLNCISEEKAITF